MVSNKDINWIYDHIQDCHKQAKGLEKSILRDILGLFELSPEKWIPVTEAPKRGGLYCVYCAKNGLVSTAHYYCEFERWGYANGAITHWMPLPEPPKEDE